jgi:hypothetical protein
MGMVRHSYSKFKTIPTSTASREVGEGVMRMEHTHPVPPHMRSVLYEVVGKHLTESIK